MQPTREGRWGELPKVNISPGLDRLPERDADAPHCLPGRGMFCLRTPPSAQAGVRALLLLY